MSAPDSVCVAHLIDVNGERLCAHPDQPIAGPADVQLPADAAENETVLQCSECKRRLRDCEIDRIR